MNKPFRGLFAGVLFATMGFVSFPVSLFASPEPGLKQYRLVWTSGNKYFTPDDWQTCTNGLGYVVVPGALMAKTANENGATWKGVTYPFGNYSGYWYEGYVKLEAGKTYSAKSAFDDGGCVYIDGQMVYQQGSTSGYNGANPSVTPVPFECTTTDWYPLQIGVWDWGGGRNVFLNTIAIVQWSDGDPDTVVTDYSNTNNWHEFWDADDDGNALGTFLYTEYPDLDIPSFESVDAPVLADSTASFSFKLTAGKVDLYAEAIDSDNNVISTSLGSAVESSATPIAASIPGLVAGKSYAIRVRAETAMGNDYYFSAGSVYVGEVTIAAGTDAVVASMTKGTFTVSRSSAASATAHDLVVEYIPSGATAGTHYRELAGAVTIPAGSASATIDISPLWYGAGDVSITLSLVSGKAHLVGSPSSDSITIHGSATEPVVRYVATTGSDTENDGRSVDAPFASLSHALADIAGLDDTIVFVAPGTYEPTTCADSRNYAYSAWELTNGVSVIGTGATPDDTVFSWKNLNSKGERMFLIDHADAHLKNVTVKDAELSVSDSNDSKGRGGANILLGPNGGTVEDCVISHGKVGGWNRGGGNFLINAGTVTRCYITRGVGVEDRGPTSGCETGCAARMLGGTIENSVIAGNGGTTYGQNANGVTIYMTGSSKILNCTIANNTGNTQNAGVYVASQNCRVINTAIFGNTLVSDSTGHNAVYGIGNASWLDTVFSNCASTVSLGASSLTLEDAGFADITAGDFHLGAGSLLRDAGDDSALAAMASATDYEGGDRNQGTHVDIGAYEFNVSAMSADFSVDHAEGFLPFVVTFTAALSGKDTSNPSFEWDFDGDGTYDETTTASTVAHTYSTYGVYNVGLRATVGVNVVTAYKQSLLTAAPETMYVNATSATPAAPYDTLATAARTIQPAYDLAIDGCEIRMASGRYEQGKGNCVYIGKGVRIIGTGATPYDVVITNTAASVYHDNAAFFVLRNPDAFVANLTMDNGGTGSREVDAGAFSITAAGGTVSNCVVRHATTTNYTVHAGGCYAEAGLVTHTFFDNCVNCTSIADANYQHAQGAYICGSARLENCLFTNMRSESSVIYLADSAVARNVTVADSTVTYSTGNKVGSSDKVYRAPSFGIACYGNAKVYDSVIVNVNRPAYLCYNDDPENPVEIPATDHANWGVGDAFPADSKKKFSNCVTDDETPINDTCAVATRAQMFKPDSFIPLTGGALYGKGNAPAGWSAITDLAGNPRVFGKAIDIGCYECQTAPGFMLLLR